MVFSNTEFYYSEPNQIVEETITLNSSESKHIVQVMRHSIGDSIFITDGLGNVYNSQIISIIPNKNIKAKIIEVIKNDNKLKNITVYIPILKSSERLEFALEKCVELGITNFVVYSAEKSHKRGIKLERWEKILLASMKQSLQSIKPVIDYCTSLNIKNQNALNLVFDQLASEKFTSFLNDHSEQDNINLIFGPEAGNTERELSKINNKKVVYLNQKRLRAETAIISAISTISASWS